MWQYHIALGCLKSLKSLIPFFVEHVLTSSLFFQNVRLELQYYPCSPISQRLKRMPHNLRCYGRQTGEMFAMHLVGSQAATSLVLLRIVNNRASLKRKAGSFLRIGNEASPDWCSSAYLAYLVHLRDAERESGRVGCTKEDWRQNRLIPFGATNENSRCISLGFIYHYP